MAGKFDMRSLFNAQSVGADSKPLVNTEISYLPIDSLIPSKKNKYAIDNIEKLAADIEEMGLLHNLVVREADAGGKHEIISGERRYRACKLLYDAGDKRFANLPCRITNNGNQAMDEIMLLAANASARELSDYEKTWQAGRLKELLLDLKASGHKFKGRMRDVVAEMLDVSPAQMGRMEKINKALVPEAKEKFKDGEIGIVKAYELAGMDEEQQLAALNAELSPQSIKQKPKKGNCLKCIDYMDDEIHHCPYSQDDRRARVAHSIAIGFAITCRDAALILDAIDNGKRDLIMMAIQK